MDKQWEVIQNCLLYTSIRIAPSYPPLSDLILAMELFALCVKIVSIDKLLAEMNEKTETVTL